MVSTGPEKVLFIYKINYVDKSAAILHAVVYVFSLNQANGPLKEDDAEELAVNTISNFMMGVYRDNPWLLDMLKKHLNEIDN